MLLKFAPNYMRKETGEHNLAKKNFSNFKNIELMFGRSEDKLTEALEKIKDYKNICIYH